MSHAEKNIPLEQKAFERLSHLDGVGERTAPWVARLFAPLFAAFKADARQWTADAELAIEHQQTLRARGILYAIALVLLVLIVWAGFAEIDEVTRGEGKIIPSRQLQTVQSMDGGVIEELFVEEGAFVQKGDVLVRIDPVRYVASFQEGSARAFALNAKVKRLQALVRDEALVYPLEEELTPEQAQLLFQEQRYYEASRKELDERLSVAREQVSQRREELNEALARLRSTQEAYEISTRELEATKPLLASGAVSEIDILRLRRDQANARGEYQQAQARIKQVQAAIEEAEARLLETGSNTRNQWRNELSTATAELNSLNKNIEGLADRVKLTEIRSPVNGTVQRILHNTIGGVVQPGNALLEIVPSDDRLLVEAKIAPKDIAFLRPGLPAVIKLHAYDFTIYGGLDAELQHISADTITDEKDNTYYLIRAITTEGDAAKNLTVIPGMTVQLDVLTGKKTILEYLLKPLLRAKANALSER